MNWKRLRKKRPWPERENPRKSSTRVANVPAEIRNEHLRSISTQLYRYDNPLVDFRCRQFKDWVHLLDCDSNETASSQMFGVSLSLRSGSQEV
jgi:hypothetical protein